MTDHIADTKKKVEKPDAFSVRLETHVRRARIGMRVRIKNKSLVQQDFHFCEWIDDGEIFRITKKISSQRYQLTAPGYGEPGNYGNGAVYVNLEALLHA